MNREWVWAPSAVPSTSHIEWGNKFGRASRKPGGRRTVNIYIGTFDSITMTNERIASEILKPHIHTPLCICSGTMYDKCKDMLHTHERKRTHTCWVPPQSPFSSFFVWLALLSCLVPFEVRSVAALSIAARVSDVRVASSPSCRIRPVAIVGVANGANK